MIAVLLASVLAATLAPSQGREDQSQTLPRYRLVPALTVTPMGLSAKYRLFQAWDRNLDGFATSEELVRAHVNRGGHQNPGLILLRQGDANHDGRLSLDEYLEPSVH